MTESPRERLLELVARCEAAAGPDRELDGLIEVTRDPNRETVLYNELGRFPQKAVRGPISKLVLTGRDLADYISAPIYTASLDAAMTLVPEGFVWGAGSWGNPDTDGPWAWCAARQQSSDNDLDYGKAKTTALALCAAALKARAGAA